MDSVYHIAPVDLNHLFDAVRVSSEKPAPVVLCVSPCRSGSTVLLRVFGASGIPAYYQPWKNILRWAMQGYAKGWDFPTGESPIFVKETLGPYTFLEAELNPVQVLLQSGYPLEQVKVLLVTRDPMQTWNSWHKVWGEKTNPDIFIAAYRQIQILHQQTLEAGLPLTHFVYESVRDFGPEAAARDMFEELGLSFTHNTVSGWRGLPAFGMPGSNIIFPDEPPAFFLPDVHRRVENAESFDYISERLPLPGCTPPIVRQLEKSGIMELYEDWKQQNFSRLMAKAA